MRSCSSKGVLAIGLSFAALACATVSLRSFPPVERSTQHVGSPAEQNDRKMEPTDSTQEMNRLIAEFNEHAQRRRFDECVAVADQFERRFPGSPIAFSMSRKAEAYVRFEQD